MEWTLHKPGTDHTWSARTTGATLHTHTDAGPTRERVFADPGRAAEALTKDAWTRLRDGFVLVDGEAEPGRPALLCHAGPGFSWPGVAALCSAEEDDSFYTVAMLDGATLIHRVTPEAELNVVAELPADRLVRSLSWARDHLWANVDGRVYRIDPATGKVTPLTAPEFTLGGSLQVSANLVVWYDGRAGVVTDAATGVEPWRRDLRAGWWRDHTPVLALGVSTTQVAYTVDPTAIVVVDLADGRETVLHPPEPELIEELWLTEQGTLFSAGPYAPVRRYDLATRQCDQVLPASTGAVAVTMNRDRTRLAVVQSGAQRLRVYDAATLAVRADFPPAFTVGAVGCAFTTGGVAVATDRGCVAWYPVAE